MGISVHVRTFTGVREHGSVHAAISALCARAAGAGYPMLGFVDAHDDTVFNRSQMRVLVPELHLLSVDAPEGESAAVHEILALAELVKRSPHRYLVFSGN
jgi:hypothetical protein